MTDLQVPPNGPFPDDQDPDKPFYVNKTLAAMSRIKSEYRGGRWLYAKNMTDEEIRKFYELPIDAVVEREGDTVAVWNGGKGGPEPKFTAFEQAHMSEATTVEATIAARQAAFEAEGHRPAVAAFLADPEVVHVDPENVAPGPHNEEYWRERAKRAEKGMMEEMRLRLQAREPAGEDPYRGAKGVEQMLTTANDLTLSEAYRKRAERAEGELARVHSAEPRPKPAPLPVPITPYVPSRDIEGTLRTCGMKLFELIENVEKTHKDEAHKMLILSNEIHAMASRFELGKLRAGMKKR
jgi:hypothetical protein